MKYKIYNQDVRQWAKEYKGEKFHALFCDAPYHLSQSNAEELGRWSFKENIKTSRKKRSTGFMGMKWDGGDVAMNPETWRALAEHLYPGAFLFVYAGTMNDDLISYAMRQAGLEKFHSAKVWNFSSGFPKATRIDTAIDRAAGAEREIIKMSRQLIKDSYREMQGRKDRLASTFNYTAPATDLAKAWSGHRYGKQSLKPSLETVLIFIKPYAGRPIDSITKNWAGALNIEAGRIGVGEQWWERENAPQDEITRLMQANNKGRWPANFFIIHSPECVRHGVKKVKPSNGSGKASENSGGFSRGMFGDGSSDNISGSQVDADGYETIDDWQCIEQCPVRKLGEQSGECKSGGGDTGTASRFFHNASWQLEILEQIERADEVQYCAKAGAKERERGLLGSIPCLKCSEYDTKRHIIQASAFVCDECGYIAKEELNRCPQCENESTFEPTGKTYRLDEAGCNGVPKLKEIKARKKEKGYQWRIADCRRCNHPTVKPLMLNKIFCSLLLPPKEYSPRRLLVPFSGVASEMIGAILAGWDEVVGIESDTEHGYIKIAEARLSWWVDKFEKCGGDYEKLKAWLPKHDEEKEQAMKKQISLF